MAAIAALDSASFWVTVALYAMAAAGYSVGAVLEKPALNRAGRLATVAGLVCNLVNVILHWIRVGHGPYIGRVEVISSTALVVVFSFLIAQWAKPSLAAMGGVVQSITFLALGAVGATSGPGNAEIPLYYRSGWLAVHVVFTQLWVAFAMLAVGLAVHHLRGAPPVGRLKAFLPPAEDADLYIYRFTLLGFIFLTIMIISGSIWANSAWGSYWSWDPIEVWSLIAWLISATELHLIRTYNWHGRQLAWVSVLALAVALFAAFGSVIIFPSIHQYYMVK